jgi:hypothetical protein
MEKYFRQAIGNNLSSYQEFHTQLPKIPSKKSGSAYTHPIDYTA